MTDPAKPLIDRPALLRHRIRATAGDAALFLHEAAADEIEDRLAMVNRAFKDVAIVTGHTDFWASRFPDATILPDEDTLALRPEAHDLVIHAMALHWANDPVGQLIQCRRALRADGMLLAVLFGGQTLNELRAALAEAEAAISGGLSPRVLPMAEIRDLGALLQRAGLALPVADSNDLTVTYADLPALMRDLRAMGETNALTGRLRRPTRRAQFDRAAEIYRTTYSQPDGRLPATFEMITLTGWAPDASQQKPLRPGSAQARLADALATAEKPLKQE